jgi:SpoVG
MNIRVEEIRKLERGSLRGFATVNVAGLIRISHIKIIHPEGKEPFIQMPQRSYQTNDGGRRYSNVVDLPDDLKKRVETAVLSFWGQQQHRSFPEEQGAPKL